MRGFVCYTVPYFNNPFGGSVLAKVVDNIKRSFLAAPRNLRIMYYIPGKFNEAINGCDWLAKRTQVVLPGLMEYPFGIYEGVNVAGEYPRRLTPVDEVANSGVVDGAADALSISARARIVLLPGSG